MKENVRVRSGCENVQVIPQSLILRSEEWHNVEIDFWIRVGFEPCHSLFRSINGWRLLVQ